jgi:hypothetical protein
MSTIDTILSLMTYVVLFSGLLLLFAILFIYLFSRTFLGGGGAIFLTKVVAFSVIIFGKMCL